MGKHLSISCFNFDAWFFIEWAKKLNILDFISALTFLKHVTYFSVPQSHHLWNGIRTLISLVVVII